jgi:NADH:quinone reductase (non-electrogenic)
VASAEEDEEDPAYRRAEPPIERKHRAAMKTRITQILGIRYPIVQGGMQWVGTADLASAVSNAGGFGIITALTFATPDDLDREIARCRSMTDKPFGVNLTILPTLEPVPYQDYVNVIVRNRVGAVETAGSNPKNVIPQFKDAGIVTIHKATSIRHCLTAQRSGVDILSVDGFECAGHPGEDDVPNFVLLARAAEEIATPYLASGGIGTGRQLAAALMLGADGINMGTRFLATAEAPVHERVKRALVEANEIDTALILRTVRNTARVYNNSVARVVRDIEARPGQTDFAELAPLVSGKRGRKVFTTGDLDAGILSVGQVVGLIHDVPTCAELIERIVADARAIIGKAHATAENV